VAVDLTKLFDFWRDVYLAALTEGLKNRHWWETVESISKQARRAAGEAVAALRDDL